MRSNCAQRLVRPALFCSYRTAAPFPWYGLKTKAAIFVRGCWSKLWNLSQSNMSQEAGRHQKEWQEQSPSALIPELLSSFSLYRRSFLTPYSQTDEDRRLKLCFSMGTIARLIILLDTTVIRKKGRKRSKNVEQNFPVSLVSLPNVVPGMLNIKCHI